MAKILYKSGSNWVNAALAFYPVGAVYIHYSGAHTSNTNNTPANQFGGTWAQLSSGYALTTITSGTSATAAATAHNHSLSKAGGCCFDYVSNDAHSAMIMKSINSNVSAPIASQNDWTYSSYIQGTVGSPASEPVNATKALTGYTDSATLGIANIPQIKLWCWRRTA